MNTIPDLKKTDYVIVGEVRGLGPEPKAWSGRIARYQEVEYAVRTVLKGENLPKKFVVSHAVVKDSPTARKDRPGLSPDLFANGQILVVAASNKDGRLIANLVSSWSEKGEKEIRERLRPGA